MIRGRCHGGLHYCIGKDIGRCDQLGVTSDRLDYIVVEKGSEGFLGIGRKQAVIKARRKREEKPVEETVEESKVETPVKEEVKPEKKTEKKPAKEHSHTKKNVREEKPEVKSEPKKEVELAKVEDDRDM